MKSSAAPSVLHGSVIDVDTGNGVFYIDDPSGDLHALLTATENAMLTVFNNHDTGINEGAIHTAGTWGEESIEFSEEFGGVTIFTTSSAFPAHAVGWVREANVPLRSTASQRKQPNANKPIFFPIIGITANTITVTGDLTGVAQPGDQYFILHPAGIDNTNGAVNVDPQTQTTAYLAFGYRYITPMAGVHTGSAIEGRQAGNNLAGQYQVWNRNYLPDIGRWTTTDPAASPWSNLLDYCAGSPVFGSDPTGLEPVTLGSLVSAALAHIGKCAIAAGAAATLWYHGEYWHNGKSQEEACTSACRAGFIAGVACLTGPAAVITGTLLLFKAGAWIEEQCAEICKKLLNLHKPSPPMAPPLRPYESLYEHQERERKKREAEAEWRRLPKCDQEREIRRITGGDNPEGPQIEQ